MSELDVINNAGCCLTQWKQQLSPNCRTNNQLFSGTWGPDAPDIPAALVRDTVMGSGVSGVNEMIGGPYRRGDLLSSENRFIKWACSKFAIN